MQASFATLLFSGTLAASRGLGFQMTLAGAAVIGLVLSLAGSYPVTVGMPHQLTIPILALLSARLSHHLPTQQPGADAFATVVVMIAATTLLFGLISLLLGMSRAGNLFRFLPYPVLGGFVAGSGLLLAKGGLSVMLASRASAVSLPLLTQGASLPLWLPGVAFGLSMFLASRIWRSWLTIPSFLLFGLLIFHALLALTGDGVAEARQAGFLPALDPYLTAQNPAGRWPDLHHVGWATLGTMIPDMLSVTFLASLGTLLNASSIEVTIDRELNLNRDLKAVGIANLLAACVGSPAGFHSQSVTTLPHHMGVNGRSAVLISAALCLATMLGGQGLVQHIPYVITGGLLLYLGLSMVAKWLLDQRAFLSSMEFYILIAILLMMVTAGWLAAIIFGLILAVMLFTFEYSRISAIRSTLTGRNRRSNVDRNRAQSRILEQHGDSILILCLQGHIFFGTAHTLLKTIRHHLESHHRGSPQWVLIDMRLASGLDASAINTFSSLRKLCDSHQSKLILTAPGSQIIHSLRKAKILKQDGEGAEWFADLDHGLEHCENELLAFHADSLSLEEQGLETILSASNSMEREARKRLLKHLTLQEWPPGSIIIEQGSPPPGLYFILSGQVVVEGRNRPDGPAIRLRTMDPGTCIGEISFYLQRQTTASVIAQGTVRTLSLSLPELRMLEDQDSAAASLLHKNVARRLGKRLILTNELAFNLSG
ncbi:MAG: hypothetical protein ER33_12930 [Cyanobium sp. CACIAM 14]|nr:MAG: hypothetical protein ER33_12930 [Cyanobium sp. CACIAM 14]